MWIRHRLLNLYKNNTRNAWARRARESPVTPLFFLVCFNGCGIRIIRTPRQIGTAGLASISLFAMMNAQQPSHPLNHNHDETLPPIMHCQRHQRHAPHFVEGSKRGTSLNFSSACRRVTLILYRKLFATLYSQNISWTFLAIAVLASPNRVTILSSGVRE